MTYLKALELLTKAYKAAKGKLPEGIDLLKMKMKARRKALESKKIIQFPPGGKDKTNPFGIMEKVVNKKGKYVGRREPKPTETEIMMKQTGIPVTVKGKTTTMTPDGILKMLMGKGKGKDVKIGQAPKTKKVKEAVDPKLVQQESTRELYRRLMRSNREAIKNFKNRNKPRDDKATGGLANLSQTYDNNPTLQSQFPDKQDYLDLFSSTTTTTPQTTTYTQMTEEAPAGIPAVKPIVPIIPIPGGDGGDGGGITNIDRGLKSADDYGFGPYGNNFNDPDVQKEIDALNPGGVKGFMQGIGNFYKTVSPFLNAKRALAKGQDFALDLIQKAKEAAAARAEAKLERERIQRIIDSGSSVDRSSGGQFGSSVNEATGARGSGTGFSNYS